jgi:nicotinamidase-related amidase
MNIDKKDTAVVFTDPQNEVLSERGLGWGLVCDSVGENKTIENMERIFETAKRNGYEVFISPHYCGRGISPNLVEEVIRTGKTATQVVEGVVRTLHTSGTVQVVTEQAGRIVVTVNPFSGGG